MADLPTGTVTFLFTDIEGSTIRWEQHREAMHAALARHDAILRQAIEEHGGVVFKTVGDAFYAAFATASDALEAALVGQRALQNEAWDEQFGAVRVRMALHTGTPEVRGADYFGPPLNRVARLLSAAHGGQVLLSLAAQELIRDHLPPGVALQDLGEHRLKDLIRPERVFQLCAPDLPGDFPPLNSLGHRPNNLPVQPTPFIGREQELAAVRQRLLRPEVRLLTLTGPGGTGKTRLALQVAADLLDAFPDGVWLVNLAPIMDPALVPATIATTLGVTEVGGQPLVETLQRLLRAKHLLLLLDNFEQVLPAAPLVADLLAAAPGLKVLVTSRALLGLYGEHDVLVPPLQLPDPTHLPPLEHLSQYEAVRLFIERAQAVRDDFTVTNENAPAVAAICARLDGLPLAIELAAARIRLLPPHALLQRMSRRLQLLTGGGRNLPARHQTLRGTIEWSYSLLDQGEQALFARLGVFAGGCTLEAVEAVCTPDGDLAVDVLEGVASLVDKSLLRQVEGPEGEPRFTMLETIREYALEQLAARSDGERVRRQHARYYLALVETAAPKLTTGERRRWLERLEAELDNVRGALAWSQTEDRTLEVGLHLAAGLTWFWYFRGYFAEGRHWLESGLARTGGSIAAGLRAKVLAGAGFLAWAQGEFATAHARCEQSVTLFRAIGDQHGLALALIYRGWAAVFQGDAAARADFEESLSHFRDVEDTWGLALAHYCIGDPNFAGGYDAANRVHLEEARRLFRQVGDSWGLAFTLESLGHFAREQGDVTAARALYEETLALRRELNDKLLMASALYNMGELEHGVGNDRQAVGLYQQSLTLFRAMGFKQGIVATLLYRLGWVAQTQGDAAGAVAFFKEGLESSHDQGDTWNVWNSALCLGGLGSVAWTQGRAEHAVRLFGAAEALLETTDRVIAPVGRTEFARVVATVRAQVDKATWEAAWAEGRAMSLEQAIAYALEETG